MGANENFVPVCVKSGGDLETDGSQKHVQVVSDSLIQAIELSALLFNQNAVAAEWR